MDISSHIEKCLRDYPDGHVFFPSDLTPMYALNDVYSSLQKMVRMSRAIRLFRGCYVLQRQGRFGWYAPNTTDILHSIEIRYDVVIVTHGTMDALNMGLTTQVPMREIFLTSGKPMWLHIGKRDIELRSAHPYQCVLGMTRAGQILRALDSRGPEAGHDGMVRIIQTLNDADWLALSRIKHMTPVWIQNVLADFERLRGQKSVSA